MDLRAFGLNGSGVASGVPAIPGIPAFPSLSAGGGGPATSDGQAMASSGYDGSGWAINFAGEQSASSVPSTIRTGFDQTGLPQARAVPMPQLAQTGQAMLPGMRYAGGAAVSVSPSLSPTMLMGFGLLLVLALRHR